MTERPTADSTTTDDADAPEDPARPGRRRVRALAVWAVAFVVGWFGIGLPTDPLYAFLWLWALAVAWRIDRPWRSHLAFARDWLPVILLLVVYNFSRGFADGIRAPHVTEMINFDRWLFGWATGGKIPTVWLQERLYDPTAPRWWDVLVSWVYFSHFVVSLGIAVVLWLTARPRWAAFLRRWFVLSLAGLVTYFIYPAAPPWWAAKYGYLTDPVARLSVRGWHEFGMHGAGNMLKLGQLAANPVAAIPSLHTAFALSAVAFFLPTVRRRFWPLLLAYPLTMAFVLVYSGEHYVTDVLVGWAYVVATYLVVGLAERWWARRRRVGPASPAPTDATAQERDGALVPPARSSGPMR